VFGAWDGNPGHCKAVLHKNWTAKYPHVQLEACRSTGIFSKGPHMLALCSLPACCQLSGRCSAAPGSHATQLFFISCSGGRLKESCQWFGNAQRLHVMLQGGRCCYYYSLAADGSIQLCSALLWHSVVFQTMNCMMSCKCVMQMYSFCCHAFSHRWKLQQFHHWIQVWVRALLHAFPILPCCWLYHSW